MTILRALFVLCATGLAASLAAQSGIGVIPTNADYALHIKTSSATQDPLRLEGLRAGTAETSVLVTDANGGLSYRPAADLFSGGGLWVNNSGDISPLANRPVGIGQTTVDPSIILGVTGNQRLGGASRLQFRDQQNYIYSPTSANYLSIVGRDFVSFRDRADSRDLLTVRTATGRIGILNDNPSTDFEVSGTQRMTGDERLEFRDGTNYIHSSGSNNNWYFRGQQYVVFRDRNDAVDILTIQANTDRVGILNRNPAVDFEVSGTQRMTNDEQLQFGSTMNYIYARNNQDLRIHGFTETNFMARGETSVVMNVDANTSRVGVRTDDPDAVFHVASNTSLNSTGGGVARFGDGLYVGVSQNQIGAYIGNATNPLHLQQFGNSLIVGAGNPSTSLLDARGSARIGVLPSVATDEYVVTANASGDLQRMNVSNAQSLLGDNLGDHIATQNIYIEKEFKIEFDSDEMYINRFGQDIDIVDLSGGVHVHAQNLLVTNERIESIATFDGAKRRVAFGVETNPDATIHIDPANGDLPLRIEDIPLAPTDTYRRLLINDAGYVYRSRSTFNRNGLVSDGPPKNGYQGSRHVLERIRESGSTQQQVGESLELNEEATTSSGMLRADDIFEKFPEAVDTSGQQMEIKYEQLSLLLFQAIQELDNEKLMLQRDLLESQQLNQSSKHELEAKLNALTKQVDKIYSATGLVKEHGGDRPTCGHKH